MAYLVLARKYRPQKLDDLVGQEHIAEILKNAIKSNRVAHSYLFCGPRGIGKTSCARILAMCLNAEGGPRIDPDISSSVCQEIAKGTSLDVLEIDGASNRGIDEIRMLRENVKFAPSYAQYKIYIVDEVHMLTTEAFNALLKTLEEPPEHVKFIFATTDPNKVPATIVSRCQRFDFKRLSVKSIVDLLKEITQKEKVTVEDEALFAIAKAADGGMRDALSILDQMIALSQSKVAAGDVYNMLGLVETDLLFKLTDAVGVKNAIEALQTLQVIIDHGKDLKQLYKDLTDHLRNLMVIKVGGKAMGKLVDYPLVIKEMFLTQAEKFTLKQIIVAIDTIIGAQESARITESLRLPLEVALVKLTYQAEGNIPAVQNVSPKESQPSSTPRGNLPTAPQSIKAPVVPSVAPSKTQKSPSASIDERVHVTEVDTLKEEIHQELAGDMNLDKIRRQWDTLTFAVSREKMSTATFLQEGAPIAFANGTLRIGFPAQAKFQMESLLEKGNQMLIEKMFMAKLGVPIKIEFAISESHQATDEDDVVKSTLETFKGKVVNRWHNE